MLCTVATCVKNRPLVPCYIIIFAGLLACGLYNVIMFVRIFFNDNRVTQMRVVTNGTCPFLEDVSVRIAVRNRLSLRETWHMNDSEFKTYKNRISLPRPEEMNVLLSFLNQTAFGIPLEYRWGLLEVRDIISRYEYSLLDRTPLANMTSYFAQRYKEKTSYWLNMVDEFLQNYPAYRESDEDTMAALRADFTDATPYAYDDYTKAEFVQFVLPVTLPSSDQTATAAVYGLGPAGWNDANTHNIPLGVTLHVPHKSLSRKGYMISLETGGLRQKQIWLTVTNNGIYDRSAFPPCRDEELDEYHCSFDCNMRLVSRYCKCIPFTYRRLFETNGTTSGSFCTLAMYNECSVHSYEDRFARCKEYCAVPQCVVTKNDYHITTTSNEANVAPTLPQYPIVLLIRCPAKTHVWYVEMRQNTLHQLLNHVGSQLWMLIYLGMFSVLVTSHALGFTKRKEDNVKNDQKGAGVQPQVDDNASVNDVSAEEYKLPLETRMKILEEQMTQMLLSLHRQ